MKIPRWDLAEWLIMVAIAVLFVFVGYATWQGIFGPEVPCEAYRNVRSADTPARCLTGGAR